MASKVIDGAVMWTRIKSLADSEMNDWEESELPVPIGSCSASNVEVRKNAGIANAIAITENEKIGRKDQEKAARSKE